MPKEKDGKVFYSQDEVDFLLYYRNKTGKIIEKDISWEEVDTDYRKFLKERPSIFDSSDLEEIASVLFENKD